MSEKNCPFNHIKLVTYASGNATHAERTEVERHLANCPECRQEMTGLQKTWLALDHWQEENETLNPRLNDLHLRIKQSKKNQTLGEKILNTLQIGGGNFRLAPTLTLASIVALLLLMPFIQSQMTGVPQQNNGDYVKDLTVITKEFAGSVTKNNDTERKHFVSNIDPHDNLTEYANRARRDQENIENLYQMFNAGRPDTKSFTNVGFVPNANIPPAHYGTDSQKPSAIFQTTGNQTVRLNNQ